MGLGAGHAFDMINRLKQNRAQRSSKKSKFKGRTRDVGYASNKTSEQPNFKKVSEDDLNTIKAQIQERARANKRKERIVYGISIACGVIVVIGVVLWYLS